VQGIKSLLPQGPVLGQPFIDLGQRFGAKTVDPPLRVLADVDQPRLSQDPQVPRYPWTGYGQQGGQLTGGCRTASQGLQHRAPASVRQCLQNRFHDFDCNKIGT
jgi:hypothetical protein